VLTARAPDPSRRARRLGLVAALLMAAGGLGAGALPIPNPAFGLRVIGLPSRNVTLAIAVTYAGIVLMVLAWLWVAKMLRYHGAVAPAPTIAQLARTTATWAVPLALAPPLFSRDVYSYLAQSAELARGIDPYVFGPAGGLGIEDPLVRSIPTIWRDTPAPYGPLFLIVGRGITALTGNDVVLGIFAYRVLALAGLALIIWTLPRLARRCGVDVGLALWLGVGNPLVLFHLISGVHNESLMIGLMLAGIEVGLRAGPKILDPHLLGGAFLIVCAAVLIMRRTHPNAERPFRAPLVPVVPILGIASCLLLMFSLPAENWVRLVVWLLLGFLIYFGYGRKHSVMAKHDAGSNGAAAGS